MRKEKITVSLVMWQRSYKVTVNPVDRNKAFLVGDLQGVNCGLYSWRFEGRSTVVLSLADEWHGKTGTEMHCWLVQPP